jgi:heme-degrading monooxygenase HmoA
MIATTPPPPYYAVIFTSKQEEINEGYEGTADRMIALAAKQEGFLGIESAREEIGITVSYWKDLDSIRNWKMNAEHLAAQGKGRSDWYLKYKTRICKVERDYEFEK